MMLLIVSIAVGETTPIDQSSPGQVLKSYLQLQRKGYTPAQMRNLISKEYFEEHFEGVGASAAVNAEDRYATTSVEFATNTVDRAFILVKVKYTDSWLQMQGMDSDQESGGTVLCSVGENVDFPFQTNGVGYVSFLFVRHNSEWLFHTSHASIQPRDYTSLLTVTPKLILSPLPNVAPDQPISGRHSGRDWRELGSHHVAMLDDKDHYGFGLSGNDLLDQVGKGLLGCIPKQPGTYPLSKKFSVTFTETPGINRVATEGSMKVTMTGANYKVELIARFDQSNDVRGNFTFLPPGNK